jgi:23S rRNA (uracil1939-C5)-methyltransferase
VPVALVESLDREGRGVARAEGKAVFIAGALPGERVEYTVHKRKSAYDAGALTRLLHESAARVSPRCPYVGTCGGCAMQHLDPRAQVAVKQRVLEDALWHVGKVRAESMLPPIHGPGWGYRHRARLRRGTWRRRAGRSSASASAGRPTSRRCARARCCRRTCRR